MSMVIDLFAGGGGVSTGIRGALGRDVSVALNHWRTAILVHKRNHPQTKHVLSDVWRVKPEDMTAGEEVELLWASPDCTHHSVARGGKPRQQKIRVLPYSVVRWAAKVTPRIIIVENVPEFVTWGPLDRKTKKPIPSRKGESFRAWCAKLRRLGYQVEHRVLNAADFGAPTKRRRLFVVARRDGLPICWPRPTHGRGPGLAPYHTAAECIDWSRPCPSIFDRKKPLADKTLWRIAQGIRKFVLENPNPFVLTLDQQGAGDTSTAAGDPVATITTKARHAVVVPTIVGVGGRAGQSEPTGGADPIGTVTGKNDRAVVTPIMVRTDMHQSNAGCAYPMEDPLRTITTGGSHAVVAPHLIKVNDGDKQRARGEQIDLPLTTVTAHARGHALIAPTLIQTGYGERPGQRPRYLDIQKPMGTLVDGVKQGLVTAFLSKHFNGPRPSIGSHIDDPLGTVTAVDHHSLAAVALATFRGTDPSQPGAAPVDQPLPTISAGGIHVAEIRAFLTAFYSTDGSGGQELLEPMRTLTAKHRLGLVTIHGTEYQIVDIGMRMLHWSELLRAQFGRYAAGYDLSEAKTSAAKVKLIGNSVPPELVEAVVRANMNDGAYEEAA